MIKILSISLAKQILKIKNRTANLKILIHSNKKKQIARFKQREKFNGFLLICFKKIFR